MIDTLLTERLSKPKGSIGLLPNASAGYLKQVSTGMNSHSPFRATKTNFVSPLLS